MLTRKGMEAAKPAVVGDSFQLLGKPVGEAVGNTEGQESHYQDEPDVSYLDEGGEYLGDTGAFRGFGCFEVSGQEPP